MQTKPPLGRLEKVDLRNYWDREDTDFTPWLAQDDNIRFLGEAIGIDLVVEAQEQNVGPFRADILCKDTATASWVLIENQLERTDHTHLGQLLTYAAGLNAVTIVWIAQRFTDEHRATLDWLNSITDERFNFFGLEIELWRIGDSVPAPKFNLTSKPNAWSRATTNAAHQIESGGWTSGQQLNYSYWSAFKSYALEIGTPFKVPPTPLPQNYWTFSIGRTGFHLSAVTNGAEGIRAELVIDVPKAEQCHDYYFQLEAQRAEIEQAFGEPLLWDYKSSRKMCKILVKLSCDVNNEADWPQQHAWLQTKLGALYKVLQPRILQLEFSNIPI